MLNLTELTQHAGTLLNISALRKIDEQRTRVQYIPQGKKRRAEAVVNAGFDQVYTAISAQANDQTDYTGHRFVDLLRERDNTTYAILCKVCGGIHKVYHTPCYCKSNLPLNEAYRAKQTKNGLTLPKQKLALATSDIERFNLAGVTINQYTDDIRIVQVQQIHEEDNLVWGYVMLAGQLRLVCAQEENGGLPVVSELTRAGRQWTWALENKTCSN